MPAASETKTVKLENPEALTPEEILEIATTALDTNKAEEITSIELAGKTSIADYMLIANGNTTRQVAALADYVIRALKAKGMRDMAVEGMQNADWILIDACDVIIHVFRPEVRSFYNLDKMWNRDAEEGVVDDNDESPLG